MEKRSAWDMGKTVRRLTLYCTEHRIAFLSLLEPLVEAQSNTGQFVFGDHYTMFGHEVVARALQEHVWPLPNRRPGQQVVHVQFQMDGER